MDNEWKLICEESDRKCKKITKKLEVEKGSIFLTSTEFRDGMGNVTACSEAVVFVPDN